MLVEVRPHTSFRRSGEFKFLRESFGCKASFEVSDLTTNGLAFVNAPPSRFPLEKLPLYERIEEFDATGTGLILPSKQRIELTNSIIKVFARDFLSIDAG
jgi:hypothetical protein